MVKLSRSYISGHGAFERQLQNWGYALVFTIALTAFLAALVLLSLALTPWGTPPNKGPVVFFAATASIIYLWFSFEKKDPATNGVWEIFGEYWKVVWAGGLTWSPKWITKAHSVNVVRRTFTVIAGNVNGSGSEASIYSADRQKMAFEIELVIWVTDPFTWIALYASDPQELIGDIFDRTIRWFAERFPAEVLVRLKKEISQALKGELASITVKGVKYPLPNFTRENTLGEVEKTGAFVEELYVKNVVVARSLEEAWGKEAEEVAQQRAELKDADTGVLIAQKWKDGGLDASEAANMTAMVQKRPGLTKHILSIEGAEPLVQLLGVVAPSIANKLKKALGQQLAKKTGNNRGRNQRNNNKKRNP